MTHIDAWKDFFAWIKTQAEWREISRRDKQYIYKAKKAAKDGVLGNEWIENLLTKHAPGRYEFRSVVILHDADGE